MDLLRHEVALRLGLEKRKRSTHFCDEARHRLKTNMIQHNMTWHDMI